MSLLLSPKPISSLYLSMHFTFPLTQTQKNLKVTKSNGFEQPKTKKFFEIFQYIKAAKHKESHTPAS